jgi:hypothetical protein
MRRRAREALLGAGGCTAFRWRDLRIDALEGALAAGCNAQASSAAWYVPAEGIGHDEAAAEWRREVVHNGRNAQWRWEKEKRSRPRGAVRVDKKAPGFSRVRHTSVSSTRPREWGISAIVPCIDGVRQNQGRGGRTAASRRHKKAAGSGGPGRLVQRSLGIESRSGRRRAAVVAKSISKGLGQSQLLQTRAPSRSGGQHVGIVQSRPRVS